MVWQRREAGRPMIISGTLYHRMTERETKNSMFFPMAKGDWES